jgi:hypothetical protein
MSLSVSPPSAGTLARRRYPGLSSIILAALPLLIPAPAAFGFGEAGHPGISRWAFDLLQIKDSTGQQISRFPYYRDEFFENLDTASMVPDKEPGDQVLIQSAEHYYDPTHTGWVCPDAVEWEGISVTIDDGSGYNGLSGFLFYLIGGSLSDGGNPTAGTLRDGAMKYLRDFAGSEDMAATERTFTRLLGSAFHYLEDIHSPGHTDPNSWSSRKGAATCPFSIYVLQLSNWHVKFDSVGDADNLELYLHVSDANSTP